ncbi:hypothetical protein EJB05_28850 [Eragrostis curvula]|uniref:F-box domain-containing protein n=1 Tax=Eragrostis curvula TaxID=38414 RepID=A0A5J9USS1_9POAL|nr:hypothetical protein EJB05_28850 [Eragrostis curvula]
MPHQEAKVVYRRRNSRQNQAPSVGIDVLPDEALQHVLSFLPAQEAVGTCVLARRWRHLWRSIPALRFTSDPERKLPLSEQEFDTLDRFVKNLLFHRERSAPLELCEFEVHWFEDDIMDLKQIDSWIQQALLCKTQTLKVDYYCETPQLSIQDLLISQHLRTLELSSIMLGSRSLNFSSCLALKKLLMRFCSIDAEKIMSQSLENLTMRYCKFEKNIRTRISCPGLVWLELTENSDKTPILESMPSLVKALVRLRGCDDRCGAEVFSQSCSNSSCDNCVDNGDGITDSVLLKGLSEAESLELVAKPGMHTPVLEKLILQLRKAPTRWVAMKGNCNPSKRHFASNNLKVVEIKCGKFDRRVESIFSALSTYGVSIEQIIVQRTQRVSECYSFETNADRNSLEKWIVRSIPAASLSLDQSSGHRRWIVGASSLDRRRPIKLRWIVGGEAAPEKVVRSEAATEKVRGKAAAASPGAPSKPSTLYWAIGKEI